MTIRIDNEAEKRAIASIKRFVSETLEDDIGDLKASLFLEFCLREIGPTIYNRAVADARKFLEERLSDLEGTCFEPEFSYWKKGPG